MLLSTIGILPVHGKADGLAEADLQPGQLRAQLPVHHGRQRGGELLGLLQVTLVPELLGNQSRNLYISMRDGSWLVG